MIPRDPPCPHISAGPTSKGGRRDQLVAGILSPRQWAAFLTPAELVKHHGPLFLFLCARESRQQPDVATAESVAGKPAE